MEVRRQVEASYSEQPRPNLVIGGGISSGRLHCLRARRGRGRCDDQKDCDSPTPHSQELSRNSGVFVEVVRHLASRLATDPFEVAQVVHHAITTDEPKLRYAVSWGGREIVDGRARMSDEDWVELGRPADDAEYYARFRDAFGIDLTPA